MVTTGEWVFAISLLTIRTGRMPFWMLVEKSLPKSAKKTSPLLYIKFTSTQDVVGHLLFMDGIKLIQFCDGLFSVL